ncbi:MAG: TetR/AcrR family transcriptional regulator [Rhodospirillales bacterium]|nr:MAG: TetR/AcrR family transcriptional regulator [Rhodospirillales bacterium]
MTAKVNPTSTPSPRTRGRPRSEAARSAILRAARELMERGGPAAVTMEGVAERAGVGKPTVYRWWPDRHAVAMAALIELAPADEGPSASAKPALERLRAQLRRVATVFTTPVGRLAAMMIASASGDTEHAKAFRHHFVLARRAEGAALLAAAIAAGELRGDVDVEVAADAIYGPLFFRLLLGHAPPDRAFVDRLLDQAVAGLR